MSERGGADRKVNKLFKDDCLATGALGGHVNLRVGQKDEYLTGDGPCQKRGGSESQHDSNRWGHVKKGVGQKDE